MCGQGCVDEGHGVLDLEETHAVDEAWEGHRDPPEEHAGDHADGSDFGMHIIAGEAHHLTQHGIQQSSTTT
eukprot:19477-Prymnesium_polylepis.2